MIATAASGSARLHSGSRGAASSAAGVAASRGSFIRNSATEMSANRCVRSFSRQRLTIVRTLDGRAGGSALQSGSPRTTAAIVSVMSSPSNARRPVIISYSTQPNAHTSVRLSVALPRACSGLM